MSAYAIKPNAVGVIQAPVVHLTNAAGAETVVVGVFDVAPVAHWRLLGEFLREKASLGFQVMTFGIRGGAQDSERARAFELAFRFMDADFGARLLDGTGFGVFREGVQFQDVNAVNIDSRAEDLVSGLSWVESVRLFKVAAAAAVARRVLERSDASTAVGLLSRSMVNRTGDRVKTSKLVRRLWPRYCTRRVEAAVLRRCGVDGSAVVVWEDDQVDELVEAFCKAGWEVDSQSVEMLPWGRVGSDGGVVPLESTVV